MTSLEAGEKGSLVIMNSWSLDHRSLVRDQEYLRARTGHQILSSVTDEWAERAWIKISTDFDEAVWIFSHILKRGSVSNAPLHVPTESDRGPRMVHEVHYGEGLKGSYP